jgi:hypothetical protein
MGRETKVGLDYFPMDVDMHEDPKFEMALEIADPSGTDFHKRILCENLITRLYCKIYGKGYQIPWNDISPVSLARKLYTNSNTVKEIINAFMEVDLFSRDMYENFGILTSRGIQKRWLYVTDQLRRKAMIKDEHLLLDEEILATRKSIYSERKPRNHEEKHLSATANPPNNISFHNHHNKSIDNKGLSNNDDERENAASKPITASSTSKNATGNKENEVGNINNDTSNGILATRKEVSSTSNTRNNEYVLERPIEDCKDMFFQHDFFKRTISLLVPKVRNQDEDIPVCIERLQKWAEVLNAYMTKQGDLLRPMNGREGWVGYFSNWLTAQGSAIMSDPPQNYSPQKKQSHARASNQTGTSTGSGKGPTVGGIDQNKAANFLTGKNKQS